jgi:hypothetical protein
LARTAPQRSSRPSVMLVGRYARQLCAPPATRPSPLPAVRAQRTREGHREMAAVAGERIRLSVPRRRTTALFRASAVAPLHRRAAALRDAGLPGRARRSPRHRSYRARAAALLGAGTLGRGRGQLPAPPAAPAAAAARRPVQRRRPGRETGRRGENKIKMVGLTFWRGE